MTVTSTVKQLSVSSNLGFQGRNLRRECLKKVFHKESFPIRIGELSKAEREAIIQKDLANSIKAEEYKLLHSQSALKNFDKANELAKRNPQSYSISNNVLDNLDRPSIIRDCNSNGKVNDYCTRITEFSTFEKPIRVTRLVNDNVDIIHNLEGDYYISKRNLLHPEKEIETRIHFKNFKEMLNYFRENLPKLKNNKDI